MKHASLKRRLLGGAAATAIGVIGAVALASPASAHHATVSGDAVCDQTTGEWVITWTVANSEDDLAGTFTNVVVSPDADLITIAAGAPLPIGGTSAEQRVSGDTTSASLAVNVKWERPKRTIYDRDRETIKLGGECAPPASPSPSPEPSPEPSPSPTPEDRGLAEATFDCEVFSLVVNNTFDEDLTVFVVPSAGETVEVTIPAGESSEPVQFPASAGLTVDVRLEADGESALEGGAFEIDAEEFIANCEDDGQGGELPTTGTSTWLIAGGAVALLALGTGLFLVARRRRITFTA